MIFLVMIMGIGGFVLVGYSQGILKQVEASKIKHNQRVLNEAKQALLLYAHNYPEHNPGRGPGRLPCPDTDNNGSPNPSFNCISGTPIVGRFPWNDVDINFYDARDSSGERLWYAVSKHFANQISPSAADVINSDTTGTITLVDQSQNIIYDGAVAGIAAIIIAPGPVISRDEDDDGIYEYSQVRGTAAERDDPRNYLDTLNTFDNSVFLNLGNNPPDGFILGPVRELDPASPAVNTIVVNDQMIVITAAEVIEMAEKATLQAYRKALNDYLNVAVGCFDNSIPPLLGIETTEADCILTGPPWRWINVYPWLYNYVNVPDVPGLSNYYPADSAGFATELATNLDNFGRIPSIFDDYFTETNSQPIESKLSVALSLTYPITPTPVGYSQLTPSVTTGNLLFNLCVGETPLGIGTTEALCTTNGGVWGVSHAFNFQTTEKLTNVRFVDIADIVGKDGQLTGTAISPESFTHEIYFWDEDKDDETTGIWTMCPAGADDPSDCDRDSAGNSTPGAGNDKNAELLRVVVEFDFNPAVNGGVVNFNTDYTNASVIAPPVAASNVGHASITGTFAGVDIIINSLPLSARYEIDRHYHSNFDVQESGTLDLADLIPGPLTLGMRYYPVLPDWALDNKWHNSIMMAYAANYRPDILSTCVEGTDCIQVKGLAGNVDNKISIITLAGQHNWDKDGNLNFTDDLPSIFDAENADIYDVDGTEYLFDKRELGGNDRVTVLRECLTC